MYLGGGEGDSSESKGRRGLTTLHPVLDRSADRLPVLQSGPPHPAYIILGRGWPEKPQASSLKGAMGIIVTFSTQGGTSHLSLGTFISKGLWQPLRMEDTLACCLEPSQEMRGFSINRDIYLLSS